jgi:DnaJ-class molecular chaperone
MANKEPQRTCAVCGKPLELRECLACGGSGKVRAALVLKRTCERCGGSGRLWLCPDWIKHLAGGMPKIGNINFKPTGARSATPLRRTCPLCKGAKGVRGPFGQVGPCPRCHGKGWV